MYFYRWYVYWATYDIIFMKKSKHKHSSIFLSLPLKLKLISLMQQTVTFWKSFCSRMWKIGMLYNRYESLSNFWTSNFGEGWRTRRWVGLKYVKRRDRHRSFKQHFHVKKYIFWREWYVICELKLMRCWWKLSCEW